MTTYVRVDPIAVNEGAATASFVIRLDTPSLTEVKVNYTQQNGSALNGSDYNYQFGTLTFAPGETQKTLQIAVINDTRAEATEVFWLDLTSATGATIVQRFTPALIFDNDQTPGTPAVSVSDLVVDETTRQATFLVSLDRPSNGPVSMSFATTDGTAVAGQDYAASAGALSFSPGETVKSVTINLLDDNIQESDERFQLVLSNLQGATAAHPVGTATIGANDGTAIATPSINAWAPAAGEGETFATFVIQLSAPSTNEVSVNYTQQNGTAVNGSDYSYYFGTLVFAPGETTKTLPILLIDDTTVERDEVFWLDLTSATNAVIEQRFTPALIVDNEAVAGTPMLSVGDLVVDESAHAARFFVTLDRPAASTVTVAYTTADETAQAGSDFRASSGTLSFAPGEMVKTVTVDLFDDDLPETDEHFGLQLSQASGAGLAAARATALIARSDTPPTSTPYVTSRPVVASEGDTFATFVVQLSAPSTNTVSVNYTQQNGTAANGSDYSYYFGTLVFTPGQTVKTLPILLIDNTVAEPTQQFWLDLTSAVNATIGQRFTPAVIVDNDGTTGTPAISVGDAVVDENAQTANFFVTLSRPSTSTVTVTYATANDTAQAGSDYTARAGTLSFAPGEVAKTVSFDIIDDNLAETDESFQLLLGNPGGATIADGIGAAMISRSDTAAVARPQILVSPIFASEGDTFASFVIQLSAPSTNQVGVNFTQNNATALNGSDYNYYFGTLVFAPGETVKLLPVPLLDDTVVESPESFTLDLNSAVNASIPQRFTTATIIDHDAPGAVYSFGLGNDRYTISSVLERIVESPNGGIDTVRTSINLTLPDNVENGVLTGTAMNLLGNTGNNMVVGNAGNNLFDGKEGIDTVVFSGPAVNYTVSGTVASRTVASPADGVDTLFSIERLQFGDLVRASDTTPGGNVYAAYAMFNAGFDRAPSTAELSQWTAVLDRVGSTQALAQAMINYYAPGISDEVLVAYLWGTIVGTPIPPDALSTYVGLVANGTYTQASLVDFVWPLDLNTVEIVGIVGQTLTLDPGFFPVPG